MSSYNWQVSHAAFFFELHFVYSFSAALSQISLCQAAEPFRASHEPADDYAEHPAVARVCPTSPAFPMSPQNLGRCKLFCQPVCFGV